VSKKSQAIGDGLFGEIWKIVKRESLSALMASLMMLELCGCLVGLEFYLTLCYIWSA
jgi:hypothetical protein